MSVGWLHIWLRVIDTLISWTESWKLMLTQLACKYGACVLFQNCIGGWKLDFIITTLYYLSYGIPYNIFLLLSLFLPFPISPVITAWAYLPALGRGSHELITVVTLLHSFWTLALDEHDWSAKHPVPLGKGPIIHCTGGMVNSRAHLDILEKVA